MTLKQKLDYHYKAFDKTKISPDPLQFLHLFADEKDIEAAGFISSIFAYGNVKQIINTLDKIFLIAGKSPFDFIFNFHKMGIPGGMKTLKHRFYTSEDITVLFTVLNMIYNEYGMLKYLFLKFYKPGEPDIKNTLSRFSNFFLESVQKVNEGNLTQGLRFMFPLPELGSACKRMNLFLRWMIREDELDFGIWNEVPKNKLIIPVDTHVARICRTLGLTERRNVSWKMAEEITQSLKKFDPADPVKYDFAICHIGMRKLAF